MKITLFLYLLVISVFPIFFITNSIADDYTQMNLPEGAIARFGKGEIDDIQYSPDGSQLAVATSIGIWIYDIKTLKEIRLLKENIGTYHDNRNISFSPDGGTLATVKGSFQGIKLWDIASGVTKKTLMDDFGSVAIDTVLFSPDGKILATDKYKGLILWDVITGENKKLNGHTDGIGGFAFSPNGQILASCSRDQTIRLWDVATGTHKKTLSGHTDFVTSVSFSPDGKTLASGSLDNTIRLWDIETGAHVKTLKEKQGNKIGKGNFSQVSFSPNGKKLISWGRGDSEVFLWNVLTGAYNQVDAQTRYRMSVRFSPDGNTIATASKDHTIDFIDPSTGIHKERIIGETYKDLTFFMGAFADLTLSPDGTKCVSVKIDNSINLWDINTKQFKILTAHTHEDKNRTLSKLLFSSDGSKFAGVYTDGMVRLWDTITGKELHALTSKHSSKEKIHRHIPALGISFSPDNRRLASANIDHNIHMWDIATGVLKRTFKGHKERIESLLFSSDGETLVSGSQDGTIRLWDVVSGELKQTLTNRPSVKNQTSDPIAISTISFNSKGDMIASGSQDGSIVFWDVATGRKKETFLGHVGAISSIFLSPDGLTFVSTSKDGSVRPWDMTTKQQRHVIAGYKNTNWVVFSYPDGSVIASEAKPSIGSTGSEAVQLWDLNTGKRIKILTGHVRNVTSVSISADGETLVSGSQDGTVLVWDIATIIQDIDSSK